MEPRDYNFYECDNPECDLRFPGYEGYPRWNRCPLCRSSLHVVAQAQLSSNTSPVNSDLQDMHMEALLDNIRSAWNVGSIFRTSDGTGIKKLYLCGVTATPDNSKVGKTALGAEAIIPWERANNGLKIAELLKQKGYYLIGMENIPEATSLFQLEVAPIKTPIVLIVGNEVVGIDPEILKLCDRVISIPMVGSKSSYNVAIAFGIAASFFLYRQRVSQGSFSTLPNT